MSDRTITALLECENVGTEERPAYIEHIGLKNGIITEISITD